MYFGRRESDKVMTCSFCSVAIVLLSGWHTRTFGHWSTKSTTCLAAPDRLHWPVKGKGRTGRGRKDLGFRRRADDHRQSLVAEVRRRRRVVVAPHGETPAEVTARQRQDLIASHRWKRPAWKPVRREPWEREMDARILARWQKQYLRGW